MPLAQTFRVFESEIWSPKINRFFKVKLVAAPYFDDYSDDITGGGRTIWIPGMAEQFAASNIPTTSGEVVATNISDTKTALNLDQWKGASFIMTDYQKARVAADYRVQEKYAEDAGFALSKAFDSAMLAQGANITDVVGNSVTDVGSAGIEAAIDNMEGKNVPLDECVFIFHPTPYWKEIMTVAKFYDASQFGLATVPHGAHDMLYGIPVVLTPQIPAGAGGGVEGTSRRNLLVHKSAFVYAFAALGGAGQAGPRIQEKEAEHLRTRVTADLMYGIKTLNADRGVRIISNN